MIDETTKTLVDEKIIPENAPELSAEDKYEQYKKDGLNTWNRKLNKGQRVAIAHPSGEPNRFLDGYINGFWYKDNLQDEDTYEEGKDNLWHDWRGIQIVNKDGKVLGSVNANQIKRLLEAEGKPSALNDPKLNKEIKKYYQDSLYGNQPDTYTNLRGEEKTLTDNEYSDLTNTKWKQLGKDEKFVHEDEENTGFKD